MQANATAREAPQAGPLRVPSIPIQPSKQPPVLIFRVLQREQELADHFRLRHDIYVDLKWKPANEDGLDIDAYDLRAVHLGAFALTSGGLKTVGGIRMISPDRLSPGVEAVRRLLERSQSPTLRSVVPCEGLPTFKTFDFTPFLQSERLLPSDLIEFSRTFCVPEYRLQKIGLTLVQGIHTLGHLAMAQVGIGSCALDTAAFYRKNGCSILENLGQPLSQETGVPCCATAIPLQPLPDIFRDTARRIQYDLATYGAYCGCASNKTAACQCLYQYQKYSEQPPTVETVSRKEK